MRPEFTTDTLVLSGKNQYGSQNGRDQFGTWWINGVGDVVRLKLTPHMPEGEDYMSLRHKLDAIEDQNSFEAQRLQNMMGIGAHEIAYAESYEEAYHLIECMRAGNAGVEPYEERLTRLGFDRPYRDHHDNTISGMYRKIMKSSSLEFMVREDDIWVTYHGGGCNHWHNIAQIIAPVWTAPTGKKIYSYYPETMTNHIDIMAKHVEWVIEQRSARSRKRFSTPLGEVARGYR